MIFKNLLKCASFMREHKWLVNQNNVKFIAAVYGMVYNVDFIQTSCITNDVDSIQAVYVSHIS